MFEIHTMDPMLSTYCSWDKLFQLYRLIDPVLHQVLDYQDGKLIPNPGTCYDLWGFARPCHNCISRRTCDTQQYFMKIGTLGTSILLVFSLPVQVCGKHLSLELARDVTDSMLIPNEFQQDNTEIVTLIQEFNEHILRDAFTGLYNKHFITEELVRNIEEIHATCSGTLTGAMLDLDAFKHVNDLYGHAAGDAVLKAVADILKTLANDQNCWAGRLGGDEFLLLFRDIPLVEAERRCHDLRHQIATTKFQKNESQFCVAVSIGLSSLLPGEDASTFLDRLDQRMYAEKRLKK